MKSHPQGYAFAQSSVFKPISKFRNNVLNDVRSPMTHLCMLPLRLEKNLDLDMLALRGHFQHKVKHVSIYGNVQAVTYGSLQGVLMHKSIDSGQRMYSCVGHQGHSLKEQNILREERIATAIFFHSLSTSIVFISFTNVLCTILH